MKYNFFQRRKILKNQNYLDLIPIPKVLYKLSDDNMANLIIPKFKNEEFAKWFIPKRKSLHFIIHLDEIGTATWIEIDGKQNVKQICEKLKEKFNEKVNPVEERVTKFLTKLYDQRYISFTILEK